MLFLERYVMFTHVHCPVRFPTGNFGDFLLYHPCKPEVQNPKPSNQWTSMDINGHQWTNGSRSPRFLLYNCFLPDLKASCNWLLVMLLVFPSVFCRTSSCRLRHRCCGRMPRWRTVQCDDTLLLRWQLGMSYGVCEVLKLSILYYIY